MAGDNSSGTGGIGMFQPDFLKKLTAAKIQSGPGASQNRAYGDAPVNALLQAYQNRGTTGNGTDPAMARLNGFDIVPYMNGTFAVNRAGVPGMGASQHNDTAYDIYDAQGNYLGSNKWQDIGTDKVDGIVDGVVKTATAAMIGGGVLGAFGVGPMAQPGGVFNPGMAAPSTGGAVGSGAGFVGEGAMSGVGPWDKALTQSGSWTSAGGLVPGQMQNPFLEQPWSSTPNATPLDFSAPGTAPGVPPVNPGSAGPGVTPPNPYANPANLGNLMKTGAGGFDWSSLVGPAIGLAGSAYSANQTGKAADAQIQAAREAQAMFKPWIDAGGWAIGQGANMLGKNGQAAASNAFTQDPGYQWRLEQGEKALTRNAAARGLMGSGKFLKDAMRFNQGEASQEFGNSFNRLMAVAGMGQTATGQGADYRTQGANAQAAGIMGRGNAIMGGINQGLSMYNNQQQQNQNNALMAAILGSR